MGVAAYNRGSTVVRESIDRDREKHNRIEILCRCESLIDQYDQFSREAQSFFVDAIDENARKGIVKSQIAYNHRKKKGTKRFRLMMELAVSAHNEWVNSDRTESVSHAQVCLRKAQAWRNILAYLSVGVRLPIDIPKTLKP